MPDSPQTQKTKTILGPDCHITGELSLDNDALIEGRVKGTLRVSGMLELSATAKVTGTIVAGHVRLAGRAEADVIAHEAVELLPGGALMGQIFTRELHIEEGGIFQGDICIGPNAVEAAHASLDSEDPSEQDEQPTTGVATSAAMSDLDAAATDPYDDSEQSMETGEPADPAGLTTFATSKPNIQTDPATVTAMLQRRRNKVLVTRNGRVTARLPE